MALVHGESVDVRSKRFTILLVRPCEAGAGKSMVDVQLMVSLKDKRAFCEKIKEGFPGGACDPELGVANVEIGKKKVLITHSGKITIKEVEDAREILGIVERVREVVGH